MDVPGLMKYRTLLWRSVRIVFMRFVSLFGRSGAREDEH